MRGKTIIRNVLCIVLVCMCIFQAAAPSFAEEAPVYIREIVTSTGKTDDEAKKWLTQNGYIVLNSDLNKGTDENPVYIGYKTTLKKSEAITDISVMDMNGGYEMMDYKAFAAQNQVNIKAMTGNLAAACREMREKLDAGSRAAKTARDYLNIFTVPEAKQALGDYLLSTDRTEADYRMILLVCNSLVINIIYTQLSLGCSDHGAENWAERLAAMGPDESLRGEDYDEYWEKQYDLYHDDALKLHQVLASFYKDYQEAERRKKENGGEIAVTDATEEEAEKAIISFAETGKTTEEGIQDAFIYSVLDYLNGFSYTSPLPTSETDYCILGVKPEYADSVLFDGQNAYFINNVKQGYRETVQNELMPWDLFVSEYADYDIKYNTRLFTEADRLGDALLEIASWDETDDEKMSLLYPLVQALSEAQRGLLAVEGLTTFMELTLADAKTLDTLDQALPEYRASLLTALDSDTASVWIGTNRDLYDNQIALTSEARRNADAANDYDQITCVSEFDTDIKVALCYIGGAAAAAAGVTLIALGVGAIVFKGAATVIVAGLMTMGGAISATVSGVAFGCVGVIGIAVSAVVIAALVVCAIVYAVDYITDLYHYYNPTYTDIPSVIVDTTENGYITYRAVKGKDGKNADINIWEGKKWNALYCTTDARMGSPLTLNESGVGLKVVYGSTAVPENAVSVTRFGAERAANLNADTYDDDVGGIYLYYFTETGGTENSGGIYLESLTLLCHENARAVKDMLKIKGCEILDFNLTSDTDYATYLGYTTTKNPANAITDIRVSYAGSEGKVYYGDVTDTYGLAGSTSKTTEGEATGLMTSLYYTKSKKRGTPICATLLASKNAGTPSGYEPVNLFSGGNAFDFNIYEEESPSDWKNHAYLYFEPSEKYDETNSELYLGGIAFVSGSTDMSYGKLEDYVKELGMKLCNVDLTKGFTAGEDRTWLCYCGTYNPYRAVYDIGVYTAEYKSEFLPENLVLDGAGYAACQTYTQGDRNYYGNILWGGNYRLPRPNHAYITNIEDYGGDDEYGDTLVCNRGMYVSGPQAGKEPIPLEQVGFQTQAAIPEGCVAVHEMTDKFAQKALNLALYDGKYKNSLYITYPGTAPVRQKYISKLTVASSTAEDSAYDTVMYRLMAAGGDEIIKINLAETPEDSWLNTALSAGFDEDSELDDYEDSVAYVRVTRTKVKNEAIGSVAIVRSSSKPASVMQLRYDETENVTSFNLAGDKISYCGNAGYYLYYSRTGNKISEFTVDKTPVQSGKITVLSQNRTLLNDTGYYFHTYSDVSLPYYSMIRLAAGEREIDVMGKLLSEGCTEVRRIHESGKPVFIGFARTSSMLKAVKNVVIAQTAEDSLSLNGAAYEKSGTAGGFALYTTVDGVKLKAITELAFGNRVNKEDYPAETVFEYVQDENGGKANISGLLGSQDSRYMFISHKDNMTYSDKAYTASIFNGHTTVVFAAALIFALALAGGGVLFVKKRKEKAQKGREETNAWTD